MRSLRAIVTSVSGLDLTLMLTLASGTRGWCGGPSSDVRAAVLGDDRGAKSRPISMQSPLATCGIAVLSDDTGAMSSKQSPYPHDLLGSPLARWGLPTSTVLSATRPSSSPSPSSRSRTAADAASTQVLREEFYERAKRAFAIVQCGERRPYGNFLLTVGMLGPDGRDF